MSQPAFPHSRLGSDADGMTLRDYFAAKAMQGLLASPLCPSAFDPKQKAASAYAVADAMLKARDGTK